ncbi:MAG: hypothetical protein KDA41_00190, partial [Planctomycetales bacterium]|nr:hypothetical protein [Planctomycetales bacterium]
MSRPTLRRGACASALAVIAVLAATCPARAQTKAAAYQNAIDLVKEALHREVYGQSSDRAALLTSALAHAPDLETAHWHLGQVRDNGKWVDFEDLAGALTDLPKMAEYRRKRDAAADDVAGNMALADWCARMRLPEQERAHLSRVVELVPDHSEARRRLGHRLVDGEWLSADERRDEFDRAVAERQALAHWRPIMQEIAHQLARRGEAQREAARARLLAIHDVAAVPAMEQVISPLGEEAALLVIEAISQIDHHEASLALARQAVYSPLGEARRQACEALKQRPLEGYVPQLLAAMRSPVLTRSQLYRGQGGSLVCRHTFAREGQETRDVAVLETQYNRVARLGGDGDATLARALMDARQLELTRAAAIDRENALTMQTNTRVMQVLEASTGKVLPATPQDWWDWWNEHNEVFVQSDKRVRQSFQRDQVSLVDVVTQDPSVTSGSGRQTGEPQISQPRTSYPCDCLAAGSQAWTDRGRLAIEEIRVGDLVLAQDPTSGELAYKPVLATTIRPASRLVRIDAGQDSVATSGGHLFWSSGAGWCKARELKSGGELHS